jgi:RNA polymerase sigma-70 factor (TIGR02960 family)
LDVRVNDFGDRLEPYRAELRVHCYRMLGSLTEAEDVLQETMLAAWRGRDGFEGRSSLRTWLYRIATNQCLNARRSAARRVPPQAVPPFTPPEPSRLGDFPWLEPFPDALLDAVPDRAPGPEARYGMREAVELAFVVGLQQLPPRQTAVLILRDVLGYSGDEVADLLDTSATAVKGALQRARATLGEPRPVTPPSARERALTERFATAFASRDIDGLISLLTDDAWLAMPPARHEYHGLPAILEFLEVSGSWRGRRELRLVPAKVNTQPAYACYIDSAPAGLMVLTLRGERISGMTRFLDGEMLRRFGLVPEQD